MILALQAHLERVQAEAAFLDLTESEVRVDDHASFVGAMDHMEQLRVQMSLLSGHAFMIQEMVDRKHVTLDKKSSCLLQGIVNYTSRAD